MEPEGSVPRYSREGLFFYAHFTEVTDVYKRQVSLQRDGLTYRYEEVAGDDAEDIPLF